ncbi:MAG: hypothetical protein CUN49_05875 [Candidatus Thermofonsia Clade 1 bacterium]|uniref:Orc1-like AAA ATPase domain-containing protein n=1 Tax=Candidatus Thermofonsia Clade 1 bacterium TaxID=2364210 RepID=A0A2M8PFS1_9CHLR|nr:MAG: hypothetical protein CUN49_05875 [Candidatus Thermofonsia Clade 1 bacterium]RMF53043.1 MAG: hypothetical protein D6749_03370 [Chloroflexota bacterium]
MSYSYYTPPTREPRPRNPLDYRMALTASVLACLSRGECCALVGVGSCGKSRFMLHLTRPETVQYHLGDAAFTHFLVLIECNAWLERTAWAGYEGIAYSLVSALRTIENPIVQNVLPRLESMYEAIVRERPTAFRYLTSGLDELMRGTGLKITLCFDEFDYVMEEFDAQLFRNLRALRNRFKYQLTYLVTTRYPIPYQRPLAHQAEVEEFCELFLDNSFAIGPYELKDAETMIKELEARMNFPLRRETRDMLIDLCGGHPGLMRSAFNLLEMLKEQPSVPRRMGELLINEQMTWKECQRIWESLTSAERGVLKRLAAGGSTRQDEAMLNQLKAKGLIIEKQGQGLRVFSLIVQEFAKQQPD